ncbi:MAG: hypothetical protein Q7U16_04770 [Agitococcus sp.]|nr:hypothetical protein [Agitococcus sp.]
MTHPILTKQTIVVHGLDSLESPDLDSSSSRRELAMEERQEQKQAIARPAVVVIVGASSASFMAAQAIAQLGHKVTIVVDSSDTDRVTELNTLKCAMEEWAEMPIFAETLNLDPFSFPDTLWFLTQYPAEYTEATLSSAPGPVRHYGHAPFKSEVTQRRYVTLEANPPDYFLLFIQKALFRCLFFYSEGDGRTREVPVQKNARSIKR